LLAPLLFLFVLKETGYLKIFLTTESIFVAGGLCSALVSYFLGAQKRIKRLNHLQWQLQNAKKYCTSH